MDCKTVIAAPRYRHSRVSGNPARRLEGKGRVFGNTVRDSRLRGNDGSGEREFRNLRPATGRSLAIPFGIPAYAGMTVAVNGNSGIPGRQPAGLWQYRSGFPLTRE